MHEKLLEAPAEEASQQPITIKKYANRRLYNTATSCYVTLDYLAQLVKAGAEFAVYDAKTGEDITRSVLTHIIVEEEAKGHSMLPVSFLRHLISFYGDSLQVVVPRYLDQTMHSFARNQEQMRDYLQNAFDGLTPFGQFEEMTKQQMAMFERAIKMFNPFYTVEHTLETEDENGSGERSRSDAQINELRLRLNQMQKQLDALNAPQSEK